MATEPWQSTTIDVVTPAAGESVTEGTILEWHAKVGDFLKAGDAIVEISTDKVDVELPSPATGIVTEILAEEGETVDVGQVIARMTVEEEGGSDGPPAPASGGAPPSPAAAGDGDGDSREKGPRAAGGGGAQASPMGPRSPPWPPGPRPLRAWTSARSPAAAQEGRISSATCSTHRRAGPGHGHRHRGREPEGGRRRVG